MSERKEYVLVERMDVPADVEQKWNEWCDTVYIPARQSIPGFKSARRFAMVPIKKSSDYKHYYENWIKLVQKPKCLIVYDLDNPSVLVSRPFLKQVEAERSAPADSFEVMMTKLPNYQFSLYEKLFGLPKPEYHMPDTPIIFDVGIDNVKPGLEDDFNAWYNTDHFPLLSQVPGFVTLRRFRMMKMELPERIGIILSGTKYLALYDLSGEEVLDSDEHHKNKSTPWTRWMLGRMDMKFRNVARRVYPAIK
jgi:hypothetical protein